MSEKLGISIFRPTTNPKGCVEIIHGMAEHRKRYDDFAEYLRDNGYVVVTFDLPGHGESSGEMLGYFGESNGWDHLLYAIEEVMNRTKEEYPDLPFFIFGHSMGSMLGRCFLQDHDAQLTGAVFSGAPNYQSATKAGITMGKVLKLFKGAKGHSAIMDMAVTGSFNKTVENPQTPFDWISYNRENVRKYAEDPYSGFPFTIQGYVDELSGLVRMHDSTRYKVLNKDMPILFVAGKDDPCTGGTQGLTDSIGTLVKAGYTNISSKLYDHMRHEILNEEDHMIVYKDILTWLNGITE